MFSARSGAAERSIKFGTGITCKVFEKRQPPIQVLSTRAQRTKVNFTGDNQDGVISAALKLRKGGGLIPTKKIVPRKSPAIRTRKRSPTRAARTESTKPKVAIAKKRSPTRAAGKK